MGYWIGLDTGIEKGYISTDTGLSTLAVDMWSTWHPQVRAPRASTVLRLEAKGIGELWVTRDPNIPLAPQLAVGS